MSLISCSFKISQDNIQCELVLSGELNFLSYHICVQGRKRTRAWMMQISRISSFTILILRSRSSMAAIWSAINIDLSCLHGEALRVIIGPLQWLPPPFIKLWAAWSLINQSNHTFFFAFQATSAMGSVGCVSKCFLGAGFISGDKAACMCIPQCKSNQYSC